MILCAKCGEKIEDGRRFARIGKAEAQRGDKPKLVHEGCCDEPGATRKTMCLKYQRAFG